MSAEEQPPCDACGINPSEDWPRLMVESEATVWVGICLCLECRERSLGWVLNNACEGLDLPRLGIPSADEVYGILSLLEPEEGVG